MSIHKHIKKILITSASLLMLTSVGIGINNITTHQTHAANMDLAQNDWPGSWENRVGIDKWNVPPKNVYIKRNRWIVKGKVKLFKKDHHTFMVKPIADDPGEIIGMDGNTHVSNRRIKSILNSNRKSYRGYYRRGVWHRYTRGHYNHEWKWVSNHSYKSKHARKTTNKIQYFYPYGRAKGEPRVATKGYKSLHDAEEAYKHMNSGKTSIYNNVAPRYDNQLKAYVLTPQPNDTRSGSSASSKTNPDGSVISQGGPINGWTYLVTPAQARTKRNLSEMKSQTLTDINNDRAAYHENPLQEDPGLDQIASIRAKQARTNFSHYDPNNGGRMYEAEVADETGHSLDNTAYAENLGQTSLGDWSIEDTNDAGQSKSYDCHNGNDMANANDDSMMNYDHDSGWGHRNDILGNYNWIGVGTSKDSQGNYYLAEDFAQ